MYESIQNYTNETANTNSYPDIPAWQERKAVRLQVFYGFNQS
jgi:hypothetical protein